MVISLRPWRVRFVLCASGLPFDKTKPAKYATKSTTENDPLVPLQEIAFRKNQ